MYPILFGVIMNTLANTQLFRAAIEKRPQLKNVFNSEMLVKYSIPDSFYNHYYKIFQSKKYPLIRYMLQLAKEERIKLVNFLDPIDLKLKPIILPPYFTCLGGKSENGKKLVIYANAIKKAGFKRNTKTQEIEQLDIDEMSLFGYLYSATLSYIISTKSLILESNVKFVSLCAEIYALLLNRCISNKQYPIGSTMNEYTRLNFITALFFLQTFIGHDVERAVRTALNLKVVDKSVIENECIIYAHGELTISNFDVFINALEKEFSYIRPGTITLRTLSYQFDSLYGETALFALEHFQSFINMIINAFIGTNLYHDLLIKKSISSNLIGNIEQAFLAATQGE
jgi:hypothetical protein